MTAGMGKGVSKGRGVGWQKGEKHGQNRNSKHTQNTCFCPKPVEQSRASLTLPPWYALGDV